MNTFTHFSVFTGELTEMFHCRMCPFDTTNVGKYLIKLVRILKNRPEYFIALVLAGWRKLS